jgi:hypothetical protein
MVGPSGVDGKRTGIVIVAVRQRLIGQNTPASVSGNEQAAAANEPTART